MKANSFVLVKLLEVMQRVSSLFYLGKSSQGAIAYLESPASASIIITFNLSSFTALELSLI